MRQGHARRIAAKPSNAIPSSLLHAAASANPVESSNGTAADDGQIPILLQFHVRVATLRSFQPSDPQQNWTVVESVPLALPGSSSSSSEAGRHSHARSCVHGADALRVTSGLAHTCVLSSGGGSKCFGTDNSKGQLGRGDLNPAPDASMAAEIDYAMPASPSESQLSPLSMDAGDYFTCAILAPERHVKCWGEGSEKQLGTDSNANVLSPSAISSLNYSAASLSAGGEHMCLIEA